CRGELLSRAFAQSWADTVETLSKQNAATATRPTLLSIRSLIPSSFVHSSLMPPLTVLPLRVAPPARYFDRSTRRCSIAPDRRKTRTKRTSNKTLRALPCSQWGRFSPSWWRHGRHET